MRVQEIAATFDMYTLNAYMESSSAVYIGLRLYTEINALSAQAPARGTVEHYRRLGGFVSGQCRELTHIMAAVVQLKT